VAARKIDHPACQADRDTAARAFESFLCFLAKSESTGTGTIDKKITQKKSQGSES
jgi:hypothetical protein